MQDIRNYLQLLCLGAVWGGSFLFLRIVSPVLNPFFVTDSRVLLGALLLSLYALFKKQKLLPECSGLQLIILATINCAIPFTLFAFAERYLTASLGSILNATTPLYSALIALVIIKERYNYWQYLGFVLGIVGVVILVGWDPMPLTLATMISIVAILIATLCYAIGGFYAARTFQGISPLSLAFCQQLFTGLMLLPFAIYSHPVAMPHLVVIFSIVGLGVLSTGIAWLLYFHLIKNVGASKTVSVGYLIPVFGLLWGHLFLGEKIGPSTLIGLFVVLLGIFLIYRKRRG